MRSVCHNGAAATTWNANVQGEPTNFWGKLSRQDGGTGVAAWHPLADHCADVASVAEALLCLPVWRRRLARMAGEDLSDVTCARLCVLAALHDIGKLNIGFQAKGRPALMGTTAGHVSVAIGALFKPVLSCLDRELPQFGDAVTGLFVAAICHHGRPYDADMVADSAWQSSWWTPRANLDPRAGAEDLLARCRVWFPKAFEMSASPLPDSSAFSHAFAGLVMLADWIGSDTRFFEFTEEGDDDRMIVARPKARKAVEAMALNFALTARMDASGRGTFERIAPADYRPRAAQDAMLTLPHDEQGSITVLEAETGSGKTEAALARFVSLFEAGLVDGMYFALPTRSAATQMHGRVLAAVRRAFEHPPAVILAVPGYLRVDDVVGEKLPAFEVLWPDSDRDRFRYRAWAAESAKRYLVGCIAVGTVDQVLLSSLMVTHAHLRATALLRHLLVVDEVHASDAYMTRILESVLARHMTAGGHALLLSATLGSEARASLLHPEKRAIPQELEAAETTPYPLITHRAEHDQAVLVRSDGSGRVVELVARPWLEDPAAVARMAFAAALQGAKTLVIKNTVRDCLTTQQAIEREAEASGRRDVLFACAGLAAPHHSRFARLDREALDHMLDQRIGKHRPPGGCVVVATQTVQQSLDLDADILFTDLCPIDVLLQRIGRLHRHFPTRPEGFGTARAVVLVPAHRDLGVLLADSGRASSHHGLGNVYPDLRILEATWRLVEKHTECRIPAMNRHLVEHGLHSSVLEAIVREGGPRWYAHAVEMIGLARGQTRQAELNLIDWTRAYAETSFPDAADQHIVTRLGEGDRRVHFVPTVAGPFGHAVEDLVLPAWWVRSVSSDLEFAERVTSIDGVTRFMFGGRSFVYDRLGLRPEDLLAQEVADDDGP
ncbi:MAG: CRISPR-associated helicase Cas3' [Acidobacteriota bacterium]